MQIPKTRKDALEVGSKHYFTGEPCKRGHIVKRYTGDKACSECARLKLSDRRKKDPQRYREAGRKWRAENVERRRALARKWISENRHEALAAGRRWYHRNTEQALTKNRKWKAENKETAAESNRNYRRDNPERMRAKYAKRRARKRNATPNWLTQEQTDAIATIYEHAHFLSVVHGFKFHVDHIIPLSRGGIHEPGNLQILTAFENLSKGNNQ